MQAVILAGGLGTRLRTIVTDKPKALADIHGKPFLEYQLELLKKLDISDVVICVGYLAQKIENYFSDGKKCEVSIRYSRERKLLGTGGALKNANSILDDRFFVLNGDTIFQTSLGDMENFHVQKCADATLALTRVSDQSRYGSVTLENNFAISSRHVSRIIGFSEKSRSLGSLINAGIYLMEKSLFLWDDLPDIFSLENDFLPQIIRTSRVYGYVDLNAYFVDIGTLEGYRKLQEDVKLGRISFV